MVQSYFPTARLAEVFAAVQEVFDAEPVAAWPLAAVGLYYLPWQNLGLAGIGIAPTPETVQLQQSLLDAVAPQRADAGTADAFVTTRDDPDVNQATMDYVGAFEQVAAGERFNPHVSVGLARRDDLAAMLAEPFEEFTFSAASAAAFQLGNLGTASRRFHSWELRS